MPYPATDAQARSLATRVLDEWATGIERLDAALAAQKETGAPTQPETTKTAPTLVKAA